MDIQIPNEFSNEIPNQNHIPNHIQNRIPNHIQNQMIKNNYEMKSFCINCGKKGHLSKKCLCPIISIGIICI